jgi:hypothetical protein
MITTVDANDVWMWLREDTKKYLEWDGVKAIFDYLEGLEADMDKPMEYDPSLFLSWARGTLEYIYEDHYGAGTWVKDIVNDIIEEDEEIGHDAEALEEACNERAEEYLRDIGHLVRIDCTDEWLFTESL